jgi:transposase
MQTDSIPLSTTNPLPDGKQSVHDAAMLPLLVRHEIQVLRRAGHTQPDVAKRCDVSVRQVRRVEAEPPIEETDDTALRQGRHVGRPKVAEPFRDFVVKQLQKDSELITLELLRQARDNGYKSSKSAFYELVASIRPASTQPLVRFEGLPGEFSQHDFGQVEVRFVDGLRKRYHFFGSRLKYSRFAQVTLTQDESVESLLRPLVAHFAAFGGVPLLAVFDRPSTVVLPRPKDEPVQYNPTFAQAMMELGVGVELCAPRSGNQKGSVERLVGWVKNSFFKARRFLDEEDLRRQLDEWIVEVNTRIVCRATGEIPMARMDKERARLRPLRTTPDSLALRFPVMVGPTGMVQHDGGRYSMPPEAIHLSGTLYLYQDRVRIVCGRFEAEHVRRYSADPPSVLPEHRAETLAKVCGERGQRYFMREQLLQLGADAEVVLTEIVHRRPKDWVAEVARLFDLLQLHGDTAMRCAFRAAHSLGTYTSRAVAELLGKPSHLLPEEFLAKGLLRKQESDRVSVSDSDSERVPPSAPKKTHGRTPKRIPIRTPKNTPKHHPVQPSLVFLGGVQ